MNNLTEYTCFDYKDEYYKIFSDVYNDFRMKAKSDYNFELLPSEYQDFVNYIKNDIIKCIILFENGLPSGFLAYTTNATEAVELNVIHVISNNNCQQKRFILLKKFTEIIETSSKTISYPVLGVQKDILPFLDELKFKTVNQSVMSFDINDKSTVNTLHREKLKPLNHGYNTENWDNKYLHDTIQLIHNSFKEMSDAEFDLRFRSLKGTSDIILKITDGIYGRFLPDKTKLLFYRGKIIGICFANLTNDLIANIPLVAIQKKFRGKSLGKYLLKSTVKDIISSVISENTALKEINATCDNTNKSAYNMYLSTGFKEAYSYKHAYKS